MWLHNDPQVCLQCFAIVSRGLWPLQGKRRSCWTRFLRRWSISAKHQQSSRFKAQQQVAPGSHGGGWSRRAEPAARPGVPANKQRGTRPTSRRSRWRNKRGLRPGVPAARVLRVLTTQCPSESKKLVRELQDGAARVLRQRMRPEERELPAALRGGRAAERLRGQVAARAAADFDAMLCHDWRRLGVSPPRRCESSACGATPMRVLSLQGDLEQLRSGEAVGAVRCEAGGPRWPSAARRSTAG